MKNLMTQKFVFGLLMVFVLALGVQGVADAQTVTKTQTDPAVSDSGSGNTTTTVSFRVTFTSAQADADKTYDIRLSVNPAVGVTNMVGTAPNAGTYLNGILTWTYDPTAAGNVSYTATITYTNTAQGKYAFSANNVNVFVDYKVATAENRDVTRIDTPEILPIRNSSSGPQSFGFTVGSGQVGDLLQIKAPTSTTNNTWKFKDFTHSGFINSAGKSSSTIASGSEQDAIKLYATSTSGGAITVNYELTAVGKHEVKVGANNETFTAYGVRHASDVTNLSFADTNSKIQSGDPDPTNNYYFDEDVSVTLTGGNASWALVDFKIVSGSGVLYEDLDGNKQPDPGKSPTQTVTTFTNNGGTADRADVRLQMRGTTNIIEASIRNSNLNLDRNKHVVTYFYERSQIVKISGDAQVGTPSTQLERPLVVEVRDAKGTSIPKQEVVFNGSTRTDERGEATFNIVTGYPDIDGTTGSSNQTARIVTDNSGRAQIYAVLPATGSPQHIDVWIDNNSDAAYDSPTEVRIANSFTATLQDATTSLASITIDSGNGQSAGRNQALTDPLVVIVRDERGLIDEGVQVIFTTDSGVLSHPLAEDPGTPVTAGVTNSSRRRVVATDETGRASVIYNVGDVSGAKEVRASINTGPLLDQIRHVTFNINGSGGNNTTTRNPYLSISPSSLTGGAGESRSFTVSAHNASGTAQNNVTVNLSSSGLSVPSSVIAGNSVTITLPSSSTTISADATGYTSRSISVNVTQPTQTTTATLTLSSSTLTGTASTNVPLTATVRNGAGNAVQGIGVTFTLSVTGSGAISSPVAITNANGVAQTNIILPNTNAIVTASATVGGVSLTEQANITVTSTTTTTTGTTTTGTTTTDLTPAQMSVSGSSTFTGEVNRRLADDLAVRIVNRSGDGVSGETVFFSVTEGSGRLTPARARTDSDGYATAGFTPRSSGTIEVEASSGDLSSVTFTITTGEPPDAIVAVSGNNQSGKPGAKLANPFVVEVIDEDDDPVSGVSVTFAVTAGGGTLSTTNATTNANGRAQTTLTLGKAIGDNTVAARVTGLTGITFKARTGAQVLVPAAQRPPMYWVDGTNGTLHRLVDAEVEDLATSAKGAVNIAVDSANGYLYWTAQTGNNKGVIRRAGLNGKGVQTLKTVSVMPAGIAIDAAGGTIYWTNARGNILSMPVSGGKVTNILRNLSSPGPIAISNGVLYWGEATGSVRKMSVTAKPKTPVNLATGLGEPSAIVIAKGKIYWIEAGGGGSGKLQRINTNGKNIQQLKAFASGVPIGLTADSSENKLYWTKRTGKIQRANFAGRFVKDIVTGLPKPGSIALGVATVSTTTADQGNQQANTQQTNTQQTTQTTQTDNSQYDVNGDGAVNQADIDQVVQAVAFKSSDMKYDINGDGAVNANDITAIVAAVNATDAAAPSVLITDIDVTLLDVTVLHEQIAVLLASGDRSLAAQRTLAYLQQLLTMARPDETVLLANYPNPFNPETWIPYHLAESTEVKVNIYDAQGTLVRALTLGHQTAGYYTSRSRAAYWDGRNALGERVASGIYFYQLETDAISPMRKMVILK